MCKLYKYLSFVFFFWLGTNSLYAQVKFGNNLMVLNPNSVLELESTNKGLLLPRLALTATTNPSPLTAHVAGMVVYNTAVSGSDTTQVTPGFYYNDGTRWVKAGSGNDIVTTLDSLGLGVYRYINEAGDSSFIYVLSDIINNYRTIFGDTAIANYLDSTVTQTVINNYQTIFGDTVIANYLDSLYGGEETNTTLLFNDSTAALTYINEQNNNPVLNLSSLKVEPWQVENSSDKATLNTQNIYQKGNVGIGTDDMLDNVALDVRGAVRIGTDHAGPVGINSLAVGTADTVGGSNSVAIGQGNIVWSSHSFVSGVNNTATGTGQANSIFGSNNEQKTEGGGPAFHNNTSFGNANIITTGGGGGSMQNNVLFGQNNILTAEGNGSVQLNNALFGNNNLARSGASNSTLFGENNISGSYNQFIIGKANANVSNSVFEIGIGADAGNRANALTVIPNGNIGIANEALAPTERVDIGSGNVRVRDINANTGTATDNLVVADTNGVLKTLAASALNIRDTTDWKLQGNGGTNENVNFLGTTDAQALVFKVNNLRAGFLSEFGSIHHGATSFGVNALNPGSTGYNPVAFGYNALAANTTGDDNVAIGNFSLFTNTSGSYNTAIGSGAMQNGFGGEGNVAIGHSSLFQATGSNNVSIGSQTGKALVSGNNNIFIGYSVGGVGPGTFSASNSLNIGNWIYGDNGLIGIGVPAPTNRLHVSAVSNPMRLQGLQSGTATDSIMTVDANGVVRQRSVSSVAGPGLGANVLQYTVTATDVTNGYATVTLSSIADYSATSKLFITVESDISATANVARSNRTGTSARILFGAVQTGDKVNILVVK